MDITSWIRVNPQDEHDLERVREMVPPEDLHNIYIALERLGEQRCVVFVQDEIAYVEPEYVFEAMYLNAEDGVDESAPVENGEYHVFELSSDQQRSDLARWVDSILPGADLPHLQGSTVPGDLVVIRPGSSSFEVFRKTSEQNAERVNIRLQAVHLAEGDVEKAKAIAAWVMGE